MNKWTVIWKPSDIDDYEYSYIEAHEPFEFNRTELVYGIQNSIYDGTFEDYEIICVIPGHVGVNFS